MQANYVTCLTWCIQTLKLETPKIKREIVAEYGKKRSYNVDQERNQILTFQKATFLCTCFYSQVVVSDFFIHVLTREKN